MSEPEIPDEGLRSALSDCSRESIACLRKVEAAKKIMIVAYVYIAHHFDAPAACLLERRQGRNEKRAPYSLASLFGGH